MNSQYSLLFDTAAGFAKHGLLVERDPMGIVRANVPRIPYQAKQFDCGPKSGKGGADLALAALASLIPAPNSADEIAIATQVGTGILKMQTDVRKWSVKLGSSRVRVNRLALMLHNHFREAFIETMDPTGGHIDRRQMEEWVDKEHKGWRIFVEPF